MTWDLLLAAVLTGTVIGAVVTGLVTLTKPIIDYWVSTWDRRRTVAADRRKLVEGVVTQLRKLRIANQRDARGEENMPYDLVLEASDSALMIHDRGFASYLALDIENTAGFRTLFDWKVDTNEFDGDPSSGARAARWEHLKKLVERSSEFAVTGKWEKAWKTEAEQLKAEMDAAQDAVWGN